MKTKVLLVDDEKLERVLIKKGFNWEENGFEVIGEASNGEEALEFFDIKEPDIVFTDINMPYMDGLALTQKIKERSPKCRVVIITGYRDFDYARSAIRLGVKDFILKPVNIKDIATLAENLKKELTQEIGHDHEINRLKENENSNKEIIIESFLQRMVGNRIEEEEAIHKLQMYSLESLLTQCVCIDIKPHLNSKAEEEGAIHYSRKILDLIKKHSQPNQIAFIHYLCNVVVYFYSDSVHQSKEIAQHWMHLINQELKIEANVGISCIEEGFDGISRAYRNAEKAISASVILGHNCCISYEQYHEIKQVNPKPLEMDWKTFVFNIENGLYDQVAEYIDFFTEFMKSSGVTDTSYLKLMTMDVLSKSASVLTKQGIGLGQLIGEEQLYEQVERIATVEQMKRCLKKITQMIMDYQEGTRKKRSNKMVDQALEYIEKNLTDPELTLKTIAQQIFVNESYLSRIFKKEMGESLIEYITRKRIEKSIELLNTTDFKVYEIAEEVGFVNAHYFGICFKKHVGVTIKEYKSPKC